jgi:hypothetical protein
MTLSQELEQVLVLFRQVDDEGPLLRDEQHVYPDNIMEDPSCGRGLGAFAFLIRKLRALLPERRAKAVFQGCIHQQTDRHHHQQRYDPLGLF